MSKENSTKTFQNSLNFELSAKLTLLTLTAIGLIGLGIRMYYFPYDIPLALDAQNYFWYAIDTSVLGSFPTGYNFPNTGWSTFLSVFFSLYDSENFLDYMMLQRYLSISISVLTVIPVYLLCTRFFSHFYSIIGTSLVIFEPRIIENSLLGTTEPLYICLGAIALYLILGTKMSSIYAAFGITALFTLTRYEGLLLIIPFSIMFFKRFRKERKIIVKYCIAITIFLLILIPMMRVYQETSKDGHDGVVSHVLAGPQFYQNEAEGKGFDVIYQMIYKSATYFSQYLGWVMIPTFLFFVPYGTIVVFKNRNYKNVTIIICVISFLIPALYAYSRGLQDTKYLYILFPIFSILSIYTIKKLDEIFKRPKILWVLLISFIISSSLFFLDFQDFDYEHEIEAFKIAEQIGEVAIGVNDYYPEVKYVGVSKLSNIKFPILSSQAPDEITTMDISGFSSLEEFIESNEDNGLTHLVLDGAKERPKFLSDVFYNDDEYVYLKKIFDSKDHSFNYHVKIYEISYEKFILK